MKEPKIMIAVPSGEMVHAKFMVSLSGMAAFSMKAGMHVMVANRQLSSIEINRFGLVLLAMDMEASHILFVDSDMTFPPDTLLRLLEAQVDVIACNCSKRVDPPTSTAQLLPGVEAKGVTRIHRVGTGVMLIKMTVFDNLKPPYFVNEWLEEKKVFSGEDYYFCNKVREAGMYIHCEHELSKEIGHIGARIYKLEDCK